MKENRKYIIIIIILFIVLIGIIGLIMFNKKESKLEEKVNEKESDSQEIVYKCETENFEEYNDFKTYDIENVTVKENQVIKTQTGTKFIYKTQELYENAKTDNNNMVREYDDKKFTVIEMNKGYTDYTKDDIGKEINVTYDEYQTFLKDLGYICNK